MINGLKPGNIEIDRGRQFTPVKGRVYLSPHIGYAQIYAIGANMAGGEPMHKTPGEKFGWLFVVDGRDLVDAQPDEDIVGELIYYLANPKRNLTKSEFSPWNHQLIDGLKADRELANELISLARRNSSSTQWKRAGDGEVAFQASVGKRILKAMPDHLKERLMDLMVSIGHAGVVIPRETWKIDLNDTGKLKKDGSNFFEVAVQVE